MAFLSECRQQAEGLEKCVASAFGPLGHDRFVRHAERPMKPLITSSGETVIDAISATNPIVRVLREQAYARELTRAFDERGPGADVLVSEVMGWLKRGV